MPDDASVLGVARIGYGAMQLPASPAEARRAALRLLRRAVDIGVELVDTACMYGAGANEELVAEALHPYPAGLLVATKVGVWLGEDEHGHPGPPRSWAPCGRPDFIRAQTEQGLRRLRVEQIDLLQLHRVDPTVPLAEQLGALWDLQREGKVARIGLSEVSVELLDEALALGEIASVQNKYSLRDRAHEPVLRRCEERGVAFLPWRPVDAGRSSRMLDQVAAEIGATPTQVSLAWLLERSPILHPIPGTTSQSHLAENVAARDLMLTDEQLWRLEQAGRP